MNNPPLLRLTDKCVKNDSIDIERKYLKASRKCLEKTEQLLQSASKEEKESKKWKTLESMLEKNMAFLKANEIHYKQLKRLDEQHKQFYVDYARQFVQLGKSRSYNVERGKKPLTNNKSAWQYGSAIVATKRKKNNNVVNGGKKAKKSKK